MKSKELSEQVHDDVCEWFRRYVEPINLRVLSQRYNRSLKRLYGVRPIEFIERDERYVVMMHKKGSRLVAPRKELLELFPNGTDMQFWLSAGAKLG